MRKRVTQEEDYLDELARLIEEERARDPDGALPWAWWKQQAERFQVTPNNIYSRAKSHGLYTPPSRRGDSGSRPETVPVTPASPARRRAAAKKAPAAPPADAAAGAGERDAPQSNRTARSSSPSAARALTERLQAMAEMADLLGGLEERVHELEREREAETARRKETLRALDRLARVLDEAAGTVSALQQLIEDSP